MVTATHSVFRTSPHRRVVMQLVCGGGRRVFDQSRRLQDQVEDSGARASGRYALYSTARREREPNNKCRRENATQSPDLSPMELIDSDINPVGPPPIP